MHEHIHTDECHHEEVIETPAITVESPAESVQDRKERLRKARNKRKAARQRALVVDVGSQTQVRQLRRRSAKRLTNKTYSRLEQAKKNLDRTQLLLEKDSKNKCLIGRCRYLKRKYKL